MIKKFDLNIEKILEDWEIYHAVREIIANAIDEELLTKSEEIEIFKDDGNSWHIRDYGRGINSEHLTQKENDEKIKSAHTIGKFGIGFKDALATFDRKGVEVSIKSRHINMTLERTNKHGFADIVTLHANITPSSDKGFRGTEFILKNCPDREIEEAKGLFLRFSGEEILEETPIGQVLKKESETARIYINGVQVAQEDNFLFSYNITELNQTIKKALNRERTNVGRTAYTDRVKSILKKCQSETVARKLVDDLSRYDTGEQHDELTWTDIAVHACKLCNERSRVVFFTSEEVISSPNLVDRVQRDQYEVVVIPQNIKKKISGNADFSGNPIRDVGQFTRDWNESFKFSFVTEDQLKPGELRVYEQTDKILSLIGGKPGNVKDILISRTMRLDKETYYEVGGLWEPQEGRIVIRYDNLKDLGSYAGILLHEIAHARSGAIDCTRKFENELTDLLGIVIQQTIG